MFLYRWHKQSLSSCYSQIVNLIKDATFQSVINTILRPVFCGKHFLDQQENNPYAKSIKCIMVRYQTLSRRRAMKIRKWFALALALLILVMMGCSKSDNNSPPATSTFAPDVAKEWMDLCYRAVKGSSISPPVASRIYGFVGVTLYEALLPGMPPRLGMPARLLKRRRAVRAAVHRPFQSLQNWMIRGVRCARLWA